MTWNEAFPFSHTMVKASGRDLRVCAHHLEDIVPYTMNICGPSLDEAVRQSLHVPHLVPFSFSVSLVVVFKHRRPGNLPLSHDLCKFGQDRFCILQCALTWLPVKMRSSCSASRTLARGVDVRLSKPSHREIMVSRQASWETEECKFAAWRMWNPLSREKCRGAA